MSFSEMSYFALVGADRYEDLCILNPHLSIINPLPHEEFRAKSWVLRAFYMMGGRGGGGIF